MTNASTSERRRYGRIRLDQPVPATFGDTRVKVIDVAVTGFLIAHEGRRAPGEKRRLIIEWDGITFELTCTIVRTTIWRLAKATGEQSIYHSGVRIVESSTEAFEHLRELVAERIMRALEEQKANAKGIPPLAAYMYQPEKGDLYRRCEYIGGRWRKTETIHPDQPDHGFTVSAEVHPAAVDMLCDTWLRANVEGRRLTQMLAELSISKGEGVPTRRYVP